MNDDTLIEFLDFRIAQFKKLEALAEAVMKVSDIAALGQTYRILIEQVNEAWKAIDAADRQRDKASRRNPALPDDPRRAWFESVYLALQKASSHRRPPVNSHHLGKIHDAAYVIGEDLSLCRYELERRLAQPESARLQQ